MALSRVQATGKVTATGTTSIALTFPSPPTVGNGVLVGILVNTTSAFPAGACTDNQGHTYTTAYSVDHPFGAGKFLVLFCSILTASGSPFTITASPALGSRNFYGVALEVAGVGGGLAIDLTTPGGQAISTTPDTGSTTTHAVTDLIELAGFVMATTQASITSGSDAVGAWTEELEQLTGTVGEINSRVRTGSTTSSRLVWTIPTSDWWGARVGSFKALPAPAAVERTDTFIMLPV